MHPPGKENATRQGGALSDVISNDKLKVAPGLFPRNHEVFTAAGIPFDWNRPDHTLIVTCPTCGGRLLIDEQNPFWGCMGNLLCKINRMPFAAVVAALVEARKP